MRAAAFAFVLAALGPQAWAQPNLVDLQRPGALDAVARENPKHYREILEITRVASEVSCDTGLRMLPVPAGDRMTCAAMAIMTSDPPKRSITFQLDDVRYRAIVTLKTPPGGLLPAR
jgi:hypothetical protein